MGTSCPPPREDAACSQPRMVEPQASVSNRTWGLWWELERFGLTGPLLSVLRATRTVLGTYPLHSHSASKPEAHVARAAAGPESASQWPESPARWLSHFSWPWPGSGAQRLGGWEGEGGSAPPSIKALMGLTKGDSHSPGNPRRHMVSSGRAGRRGGCQAED